MTLRFLLIVAAATICLSAADVSHINQHSPQDISVPFNDLLPPPLEETTTEAPTIITKPTKKSYYQQQQQASKDKDKDKGTHQIDVKPNKQPELQLFLDLLPPLAEASSNDVEQSKAKVEQTTTQKPLATSPSTTTTKSRLPHAVKPQALHARVATPSFPRVVLSPSSSSSDSANSQLSPELIAQYATYFQFTTPRTRRGPLPTLTPFPRHIKK